jgi:hypothetical protein
MADSHIHGHGKNCAIISDAMSSPTTYWVGFDGIHPDDKIG